MKPIAKEIKEQILQRVREGKEPVAAIAQQHGVKPNTVYYWISQQVGGKNGSLLETARLRKENQRLKEIIGTLMLEKERGKKG